MRRILRLVSAALAALLVPPDIAILESGVTVYARSGARFLRTPA
jgi:hypothetical protein